MVGLLQEDSNASAVTDGRHRNGSQDSNGELFERVPIDVKLSRLSHDRGPMRDRSLSSDKVFERCNNPVAL